jgi:signal transduction histidine kinase
VDRIGRSARHLLHLIDGVVELSRLRSGDLRPDLGDVNLGILLTAVAEAFRTHASERGLEARVRLPRGLPTIRSDQDRLVAALDLLVTSAIKHPAGTGMSLDVEARQRGADLIIEGAEIALRDDGDDPAVRLGIRLAVAERVAELLGGELRLEPVGASVIQRLVFTIRDASHHPSATL